MPIKPLRPCNRIGCRELTHDGYCPAHKRDESRIKKERKPEYARLYRTQRWKSMRIKVLQANPLCVHCKIAIATQVDHIISHKGDYNLFYSFNNLQSLCHQCHSNKTYRETLGYKGIEYNPKNLKPSKIPLHIIAGAPGSGKTTYVYKNCKNNALIIDLDIIIQHITGTMYPSNVEQCLYGAIEIRNRMIRALHTNTTHSEAWLVITAPTIKQRNIFSGLNPCEVIIMETHIDVCLQRIQDDERRIHLRHKHVEVAKNWWETYQRNNGDVIVHG